CAASASRDTYALEGSTREVSPSAPSAATKSRRIKRKSASKDFGRGDRMRGWADYGSYVGRIVGGIVRSRRPPAVPLVAVPEPGPVSQDRKRVAERLIPPSRNEWGEAHA